MSTNNGGASLRVPLLMLFLFSVPALAEDPYLQGLKAESSKLESLGHAARKEQEMLERHAAASSKAKPGNRTKSATAKPDNTPAPRTAAEFAEFEKGMKGYPAGFGLYEQLDSNNKQAVFVEFTKRENPMRGYAAAIKKTLELSMPARK